MRYCEAPHKTIRWKTREVLVGNIGIGGNNPVRIQSMTTSNTRDVDATVEQIMRLADAGCEIARVTVQGMKEAEACERIKSDLIKKGYTIPLVADIHFYPPAAMKVVDFVDKVRVNPGNFVDKRATFKTIEYDDAAYAEEILKIEEKFTPLVEKCKRLRRSMRIGTNHGSLSDRIMNRYGDTPQGMVESALEFARICRQNDYHDIIFSMKSSNPLIMILAYRLLVAEMMKLGWNYPLHLGVTEAGEGEDGRIKSAMGIGALLLDGLGDTIRVSLTEDPWNEISPCKRLVDWANHYEQMEGALPFLESYRNFLDIKKRQVSYPKNISLHSGGSVLIPSSNHYFEKKDFYQIIGCDSQLGRPKIKINSADGVIVEGVLSDLSKNIAYQLSEAGIDSFSRLSKQGSVVIRTLQEALEAHHQASRIKLFSIHPSKESQEKWALQIQDEPPSEWDKILALHPPLIFFAPSKNRLHQSRHFFEWLQINKMTAPVILNFNYNCSEEDLIIHSSSECGALLCDGLGEGLCLEGPYEPEFLRNLSFSILQAARMRTVKTDFISCPSCGRTLFDLQEVSRRIRDRTAHLPGVKIAIMGCIVNGPGEMADADFGYVGSKPGKIDLYQGKVCVEKDIAFDDAVDRLVDLIKREGRWIEQEESEAILSPSVRP